MCHRVCVQVCMWEWICVVVVTVFVGEEVCVVKKCQLNSL